MLKSYKSKIREPLFGSLVPAICNRTSCVQVHELRWGHWWTANNWEGTFLSFWLYIYIWHHYPPQYRFGLEINRSILSCRLYWSKLKHPWTRSNIPYTAPEPPNEISCLVYTGNASNKKPHLRLINPFCLSPL